MKRSADFSRTADLCILLVQGKLQFVSSYKISGKSHLRSHFLDLDFLELHEFAAMCLEHQRFLVATLRSNCRWRLSDWIKSTTWNAGFTSLPASAVPASCGSEASSRNDFRLSELN